MTYTYDFCSGNITCVIGLIAGGVTGCDDNVSGAGEVRPVVVPEFKLGYRRYFIKSRFFPDTGSDTAAAITLSIGREF